MNTSQCKTSLEELPIFELQEGEDYQIPPPKYRKPKDTSIRTFWLYSDDNQPFLRDEDGLPPYQAKPEGRIVTAWTKFWNQNPPYIFGLDGPFEIDGKVPVFICDPENPQVYRFGGSVLYCPRNYDIRVDVAVGENHPHDPSLVLAPNGMPEDVVATSMYLWRDGCVDHVVQRWWGTGYCLVNNMGALWCPPYETGP